MTVQGEPVETTEIRESGVLQENLEQVLELVGAADKHSLIALTFRGAAIDDNFERMLEWVTMADNKALIALTFQGAIIAGLAVMADPLRKMVEAGSEWRKVVFVLLLICFLAFFFASVWKLLQTIAPRIVRHVGDFHPSDLFFYGSVAEMDREEFTRRFNEIEPPEVHQGLLRITHTTATIAMRKFTNLRIAYWCLGAQMVFFILAALLMLF